MSKAVPFEVEKPKVPTVYVLARDPDTGRSKSTTVYNTTPEEFIEHIEQAGAVDDKRKRETAKA